MILRDELRYTDDVIATLQSDNPAWYIAQAIGISIEDVSYHYEEIRGISHTGTVLALPIIKDDDPKDFPTDHSWYASRTRAQIARELCQPLNIVNQYIRNRCIETIRNYGPKPASSYPTNPAWYAARTTNMAAEELCVTADALRRHMTKHGFATKNLKKRYPWPRDVRWYADKNVHEISDALNIPIDSVKHHLCVHRLKYKPLREKYAWSTDPAWYAQRTIEQIKQETGERDSTIRAHIFRHKLPYRRKFQTRKLMSIWM